MMWVQVAGDLATSSGADALWVPGGMFLTAAGLLFKASTTYKEARQIDVAGAQKREADAETELEEVRRQRDEAKRDRDTTIKEQGDRINHLSEQVAGLEQEIGSMRGDHHKALRDLQERHANEVQTLQRRIEREIRVAYLIREAAAKHGIALPDGILETDHGADDTI